MAELLDMPAPVPLSIEGTAAQDLRVMVEKVI